MLQSIKKILLVGLMVSCARPLPPVSEEPEEKGTWVEVLFRAGGEATKDSVSGSGAENAIGRWAVFAFDRENGWFRYASSQSGSDIPLKLLVGHYYRCFAIVNYPENGTGAFLPATVRTAEDLTEKVAYLGDNGEGSLLMFGETGLLPTDTELRTKTINVTRLVSRIDVTRVAVDFSAKPQLAAKTFTLRHIYITNAYRTTRYGEDYTYMQLSHARASWYNSGGWHRGEAAEAGMDALLGKRDINAVITADAPYTVLSSFYAFPNATPASADTHQLDGWEKRCTRIVLEATLDDETFYYQVHVPEMARNHIYSARDIVILGRGSRDPEIIDMPDDDALLITVTWQDGWDQEDDVEI